MEPLENYSSHKRVVLLLLEKKTHRKKEWIDSFMQNTRIVRVRFFSTKRHHVRLLLPALIQCDITHEIFCLSFCCRQKKSRGISVCVCAIRSAKHPSNICMCLHFWHVVWLFSGPFVWSPTKLSSYIFLTLQFYGTFCKITTSASAVVNTVTTKIITDQNLQISKNMQNLLD